jgi:hypothetical protein
LFEKSHHGILDLLVFYLKIWPVYKQGYKFFWVSLRSPRKKLIALFVDRARPIKQANPKVLDKISQTMVYYPIVLREGSLKMRILRKSKI